MNAVITFIFGKGQEILREPLVVEPGIEYVCVTDQKNLKSKTWKIVYDNIDEANCMRDKMAYVKYNPFKYTTASKICVIDGSIQIRNPITPLFNRVHKFDLLLKAHPQRDSLKDELYAWRDCRNLPIETLKKFYVMAAIDKINLNTKMLVESCIVIYNVNPGVKRLCELVLKYMKFLGVHNKLCITNQCILTYLLHKYKYKYRWINQYAYCNRYKHNTWESNPL